MNAVARKLYGDGVSDGIETTLKLLLGEPHHDAAPCPQPLPPEVERWARDALARLQEHDGELEF